MEKSTTRSGADKLHEQLVQVRRQLAGTEPIRRKQLSEALVALQDSLQEIEAVEEELAQQNEQLISAREALETERYRYRELFDRAPVGYLVTDGAGTIRDANQAASTIFNSSSQALQGKPMTVFLLPKDRPGFRSLLQEARGWQGAREIELTIHPHHGVPRKVQVTAARDEERFGGPVRLRWVLQDISERRAAEAALHESQERLRHSQRLEAIGRLAGGVAHSFNNLLASVAFHAELILDNHGTEQDRKRHALEIQKVSDRAAELARHLLAFSRKQALNPEPLSLGHLIVNLEPMLRRLLGEDVELRIDLDPEAGAVYADLGQLEQVLLNLVANARDAMPDGGILTLRTDREVLSEGNPLDLPPGQYARLTVADTGVGFSPETREHLFEPFYTTKEKGKGTGLGLATVYGIVRQSGGDVRVESEPGRGATFLIHLPQSVQPPARQSQASHPAERPAIKGSEVVLLVEDEDNIREPATEILEVHGYTVLPARNGADALEVAQRHQGTIDLMITDVIMPHLNGSRLAEKLSQSRPGMRVLYISGYPEDAIAHHGVLEPRHRFLQKPFPPGVLLQNVRQLLDGTE